MMRTLILTSAAAAVVVAVNSAAATDSVAAATAAPGAKDVSCSCRNFGSTRSRARTSRLHFTSPPSNASPHHQPSSRPVDPSVAPPAPTPLPQDSRRRAGTTGNSDLVALWNAASVHADAA